MKKLKFLLPVLMVAILFVGCDDEQPLGFETVPVGEFLTDKSNLSSLTAALERADLLTTVANLDAFTLLAPDNAAFAAFLNDNGFATLEDVPVDLLRRVLLNHVLSGYILDRDLTTGFTTTSAKSSVSDQPMSLYVNTSNGVIFNGASTVTTANLLTRKGVVHIVDQVIGLPTVVDLAIAVEDTSTLVQAVLAADLAGALSGEGPFTVLAPTNFAFGQFLAANNFSGLADIPSDVLTQTLLNHVVAAPLQSSDLSTGYASTLATSAADTDSNLSLYIDTTDGVRFNGSSSVALANINAENGVIHVVDAVVKTPSVVDFALADPNFSTLVAALTRQDLTTDFVSILSTPNGTAPAPFTVFAPINDAFGNLLTELSLNSLGDIDEPTLNATLTFHVVGGANVRDSALTDNFTVPTLGGNITADVTGGAKITDGNGRVSNIIATNVQANNGVIHAIDRVILPN